jgi:hypothetical protein
LQRTIFWANIIITDLTKAGQVQTMLERSRETALSITFHVRSYIKRDVLDQLKKRSVLCRWKSLAIKFGHTPSITHLSIDGEGFDGKEFSALERCSIEPYNSTDALDLEKIAFRNQTKMPLVTHLEITMSDDIIHGVRHLRSLRGEGEGFHSMIMSLPTLAHLSINVLNTPTNRLDRLLPALFHQSTSKVFSERPLSHLTVLNIRYLDETIDSADTEHGQWRVLGNILLKRQLYARQNLEDGIQPLEHLHFHASLHKGKTIRLNRIFEELKAVGVQVHLHYEEIPPVICVWISRVQEIS